MTPRKSYGKVAEAIDPWLESQGLYRKHTARDGSCLFRAVAEQMFYTQSHHEDVRKQCVEFIQRHRDRFEECIDGPFEAYISRMCNPKEFGGQLEMEAMSILYCRNIYVFQQSGKSPFSATGNNFGDAILLCYSSDSHYDSVYSKAYIAKAAFCQSLVYEVLYENVFKLSDVGYAVERMLHKSNRNRKEGYIYQSRIYPSSSFGVPLEPALEFNIREQLAHGITPFPYKVAKALDPDIYRNIEFDSWSDLRRELKLGLVGGDELQVGVKCLVKLQSDRSFHAHIQEMSPDQGPVMVYVEELGQKCTVAHDMLEPLPKSQRLQFTLPYHHHRQVAAISQKQTLFAFSELGGKYKKTRASKPRKVKEVLVPVNLSPRLQCSSTSSQTQHLVTRFVHEQPSTQQQHNLENFQPENFNFESVTPLVEVPSTSSPSHPVVLGEQETLKEKCPTPQPTYVLCNESSGKDLMLQAINFLASKSLQINGSDLPHSDIPTLRFFYNLGHEYFQSNCVVWTNAIPQPTRSPPTMALADSTTNINPMQPDSTMPVEEEVLQPLSLPPAPAEEEIVESSWQFPHGMYAKKTGEEEHAGHRYQSQQQVPVTPTYMQPYSPAMVPYYPPEPESMPYYSMGSVPYVMHQEVENQRRQPQLATEGGCPAPYAFYSPPLSPIVYHHATQSPVPHWVQTPTGMPQYM